MTEGTTEFDYDYIVIGGGSGGIASAKRAASLYNAKVAGKKYDIFSRSTLDSSTSMQTHIQYDSKIIHDLITTA